MAKVVLHYFNGRGRMETIRWLLAVAGVEFEEEFITAPHKYEKLVSDGDLVFGQLPMVEIDGMKLVQTKAILNYIAGKYNLYGKDLKQRAMIDMYSEGLRDLMEQFLVLCILSPAELKTRLENIQAKATGRYLPVYSVAPSTLLMTSSAVQTSICWRPQLCWRRNSLRFSQISQMLRLSRGG
ncbi:glutathione S-transferase alpha M14-like isoform X4 [Hypomesus transpacificus]|uniref:glutathione S-transferase alpha M14-like isoform X4 n=1 Tax=Hypomesus transpacificus TaxID=137520 RepID=UPI001F07F893|nr:glutathione S-transferase alpha M14-like isoform X4 [Hypomesus transpacificus]